MQTLKGINIWRVNIHYIYEANTYFDNGSFITGKRTGTKEINLDKYTFKLEPVVMDYPPLCVNYVKYEFIETSKFSNIIKDYNSINEVIKREENVMKVDKILLEDVEATKNDTLNNNINLINDNGVFSQTEMTNKKKEVKFRNQMNAI